MYQLIATRITMDTVDVSVPETTGSSTCRVCFVCSNYCMHVLHMHIILCVSALVVELPLIC